MNKKTREYLLSIRKDLVSLKFQSVKFVEIVNIMNEKIYLSGDKLSRKKEKTKLKSDIEICGQRVRNIVKKISAIQSELIKSTGNRDRTIKFIKTKIERHTEGIISATSLKREIVFNHTLKKKLATFNASVDTIILKIDTLVNA